MAALLDTSCLYALLDKDDRNHLRTSRIVENSSETLIIPDVILPEISYLVNKFLGVDVELKLLESMRSGEVAFEPFSSADIERVIDLIATYKDNRIGFVDAAVVAIAERLRITRILTLDKHFQIIKPKHTTTFEMLPN